LEPRERLELLLEFAEKLAPLPARYEVERAAGINRVHEC
jgi:cysteine desulfuration protein SufE